jgi:hypothetical protein
LPAAPPYRCARRPIPVRWPRPPAIFETRANARSLAGGPRPVAGRGLPARVVTQLANRLARFGKFRPIEVTVAVGVEQHEQSPLDHLL